MKNQSDQNHFVLSIARRIQIAMVLILLSVILTLGVLTYQFFAGSPSVSMAKQYVTNYTTKKDIPAPKNEWIAPQVSLIKNEEHRKLAEYGQELIAHTAKYLGPKGQVAHISNGLNCQNCHLDAGTKVWGNNYGSVASMYPKFRARSGSVENIYKRVNDCFERSLNGKALDTNSREMQAIYTYITFLGSNVKKGNKAEGSGFKKVDFLDRASDPAKGEIVYQQKCQSCHQADGQGTLKTDGSEYTYPPLWGPQSYNDGAGLYRITNFAKYVKYNMPLGANADNPQLSDEEAWDVAAFVNSKSRPHIPVPNDWPDISKKPIDHPFGPYADTFSVQQHKFGPWKPIEALQKNAENKLAQKITKNTSS